MSISASWSMHIFKRDGLRESNSFTKSSSAFELLKQLMATCSSLSSGCSRQDGVSRYFKIASASSLVAWT